MNTAGVTPMNPDLKDAAGAATRALLNGGPRLALWWWAVLIVSFAATAVTRGILTTVETSTWQWAATAPKIMMLIVGAVLAAGFLPQYVSHGISRRAFSLGAGVVTTVLALTGAVIMAAGYGIEAVVYDAVGWRHVIDEPHLFTGPAQWYLIIPEFTLLFVAWTAVGWVGATGFYRLVGFNRWDWLLGTLLLIPAALPGVAAEAFKTWSAQGRLPLLVGLAGILLASVAGAVAAYHSSKDMPLRGGTGWAV